MKISYTNTIRYGNIYSENKWGFRSFYYIQTIYMVNITAQIVDL